MECKKLHKRINELSTLLNKLDIFVCVETWLTECTDEEKKINFPGFLTFRKDRQHARGGGILILIRKNIGYVEINDIKSPDPSVEMCGIRIVNTNPSLELFVCYRTPGSTLTQDEWDMIVNNLNNNKHCILVGDFNAHNQLWNCKKTDSNGDRFFKSLDDHDLFVHNDNTNTHINLHKNIKSNIDLVISTMNISEKISVQVHDETLGSDHFPIFFDVQTKKSRYIKKSFKLKTVRTDWTKVVKELNEKYTDFLKNDYNNLSAHEKYEIFVEIITKSIVNSNPKPKFVHAKNIKNPVPWWNIECDKIKRLRKAAYKNGSTA